MPWQTPAPFRPGIDVIKTPLLNAGGWSYSNLIRFRDGLPEKNGGWARLINAVLIGIARGMWIWSDLDGTPYLAAGTEQRLEILLGGLLYDITPLDETTNPAVNFSTVINTPTVTIVDAGHDPAVGDWVRVNVPVAVGGLIIQGLYQVQTIASPAFTITAASNATATVNNGGAVPLYATTNTSPTVRVTLAAHGYVATDIYINQVATTIATIVLPAYTGWTITTVVNANQFEFTALTNANATTTGSENAGNAQIQYLVPTGYVSATLLAGFGVGLFGVGLYGLSSAGPTYSTIRQWFLNNWGEDLIGNYTGSPIFVFIPPVSAYGGNEAIAIDATNFPSATSPPVAVNVSFVSMPQQIMMALGCDPSGSSSTLDPNLVRWTAIGDFTDWVATATNQAGSFRIPTGSRIVGGLTGPTFGVLWTDRDMYVFNYIGFPLVFGFNRIAGGTPLLAARCCAQARSIIYWASSNGIYAFDGSSVALVPCPVWDIMWRNLNRVQIAKCHLAVNSWFQELVLYFCAALNPDGTAATGEIDSYIRWNWRDNVWDYGPVGTLMKRTTWSDQSELGAPIGIDTASLIQQHELALDADGSQMGEYVQSGFFSINNGWLFQQIDQTIADFKFEGAAPSLQFWIVTINYPTDAVVTYGPFTHTPTQSQFDTINSSSRMAAIRIGMSSIGSWWRLGNFRYLTTQDGTL